MRRPSVPYDKGDRLTAMLGQPVRNLRCNASSSGDEHTQTITFLLWFFLHVYGLEVVLQSYVLGHSVTTYGEEGEEPYRVVYVDAVLALLMLVELRAHYLAVDRGHFWRALHYQCDMAICFISCLFIVLYILHREQAIELPADASTGLHFVRDVTRTLRLPTFVHKFQSGVTSVQQHLDTIRVRTPSAQSLVHL